MTREPAGSDGTETAVGATRRPIQLALLLGWSSVLLVGSCSIILSMMGAGVIKWHDPNAVTFFGFALGGLPWVSVGCALRLLMQRKLFQSFFLLVGGATALVVPLALLPFFR